MKCREQAKQIPIKQTRFVKEECGNGKSRDQSTLAWAPAWYAADPGLIPDVTQSLSPRPHPELP